MTSRRVPVPNPKFARSSSDDDDDDTRAAAAAAKSSSNTITNGRTQQVHPSSHKGSKQTQKAKIKEKRAKKTPVEALVVATNTKNGNHHQNASGKKSEKDAPEDPLVQPSKILIPQNGDDGPKKWRLADQRRCALNVITRKACLNHHRSVVVSRASKKTRRSRACPFGGRFWSSTERCCWDWSRR